MTVSVISGQPPPDAVHRLRREVFVHEQGVDPALEFDGADGDAAHVVLWDDTGDVGATARLLDPGPPADTGVIGRVAVRRDLRGTGLGAVVMRAIERHASDRGLVAVELHAQLGAAGFYRRLGYVGDGPVYLEAGIEHVSMRLELIPGLRPVADADGPALETLIGDCWAQYPGCVLDVDAEEPWLRAPAAAYAAWGGAMWVVPGPSALDACVGLRPVADGVVELKSLYVASAARRRGLGAALVRRVEREASGLFARSGLVRGRVVLWSDTRFDDAHRLYERLGYAPTGGRRELADQSCTVEWEFARSLPSTG